MSGKRSDNFTEKFAGRLTNIVLLGFFTTLCCLPVISAGAAFTALNVSTKAYLYEDDDKPLRIFFASFREHFSLSSKVWLLHIPALAVLIWDLAYYRTSDSTIDILASAAVFVLIMFVLLELQMVFVIIATEKENTVGYCLKKALDISLHCFGYSVMLLLFTVTVIAVSVFLFRGLLLVMPGVVSFLHWQFLPEILRKYKFRERKEKQ